LLDIHGAATTLYAEAGDGRSVLVFYRGAWCPYCNIALSVYQAQLLPQLTERGVRLIAVSPQRPDGSLTMQQKHRLDFAVVSGPGSAIASRLGILTAMGGGPHGPAAARARPGQHQRRRHDDPADARYRHPRCPPRRPLD
jgi:peroxiredoxin